MGGKAKNLDFLKSQGFNVPNFIVIAKNLNQNEIRQIVENNLKSDLFAVRSSAFVEDGAKNSFAGYFYSAIGVTKENIFNEFLNVKNSYKEYSGDVIIQEFIPSEKSGIIFTNAGQNKILINANFGLCKTVVEGEPCDEYIFSRDLKLIKKHIENNKKPIIYKSNSLVYDNVTNSEVLSEDEIKMLISKCLEIEKIYKTPQDIEWCFYKNQLYILQARPITKQIFEDKEVTFYDSANIAESYSGLVKPLTLAFAQNIYKTVYINLLAASGASRKKILKYIEIFNEMTASFYGRLYYNMNNWYLMMKFIPGYDRNKENLEDMITSNIRENIHSQIKPSVFLKIFYPFIVIGKMIFFPVIVRKFEKKVKKYINIFRKSEFKQFNLEQCFNKYFELSEQLLTKWHITVENDFLVMTYLGILKKKLNENELQKFLSFENKSAKQVGELKKVVDKLYEYTEFKDIIKKEKTEEFELFLCNTIEAKNILEQYFENYGGRFANELKLESADIEEDKSKLLKLFKLYENYSATNQINKVEKHESFLVNYALKKFKKYASKREDLRLLRSNTFSVVRKIFNRIAEIFIEMNLISETEDIYYLKLNEIFDYNNVNKINSLKNLIIERKKEYEKYKNISPQPFFNISVNQDVPLKENIKSTSNILIGRPCTQGKIRGKIRLFKEYFIPENIDFDIIVTKHTDPGWTTLIGLCKGMIIEHGGILSHAAIVSRELGIPTVIGVENVLEILNDNQLVEIDGSTGKIMIIGN